MDSEISSLDPPQSGVLARIPLCDKNPNQFSMDNQGIHAEIASRISSFHAWNVSAYEFNLPTSQFEGRALDFNINNRFEAPRPEEMRGLAFDSQGDSKKLTRDQYVQLKRTGQFSVASEQFPGQMYEWEINRFFLKGTKNIHDTLMKDIGFGTNQFAIVIPNLIWSGNYKISVFDGLQACAEGVRGTLTVPWGWFDRTKQPVYDESSMNQYRVKMLLEELLKEYTYDKENHAFAKESSPMIWLISISDRDILGALSSLQDNCLSQIKKQQCDKRAARLIELAETNPGKPSEEIRHLLCNLEFDELQTAIYDLLKRENAAASERFVELMKCVRIVRASQRAHAKRRAEVVSEVRQRLAKRPVMGSIDEWVENRVADYLQRWDRENTLEQAVRQDIENAGMQNTGPGYLLCQNLDIVHSKPYQDRESEVHYVPVETFEWDFVIWRPSKWIITKSKYGEYTAQRSKKYKTSSAYPGWRFANLFMRAGRNMWDGAYYLFVNAIYGPFGLRALVGTSPFQPGREIDYKTGAIVPSGECFRTWLGRVRDVWEDAVQSRRQFHATPDAGFFGKSIVNPFNWFWNYVCKGVVGTCIVFVGHPVLTVVSVLGSILLAVGAPLWAVVASLIVYVFNILIYDTEEVLSWFPLLYYLVWKLGLEGIGQILLSLVLAAGSGLLGVAAYGYACIRASLRWIWDTMCFYSIVKPFGRVPYDDSFTARMVAGPGLSMNYYHKIEPELVRLILSIHLEAHQMKAYQSLERSKIMKPLYEYDKFMATFNQHGLRPDSNAEARQKIVHSCDELVSKLSGAITKYERELGIGEMTLSYSQCRLTRNDLRIVLHNAAAFCEEFHRSRIFPYMTPDQIDAFCVSKELDRLFDWEGLAKSLLMEIFGPLILQPIEDDDKAGFRILVENIDTKKYFEHVWMGSEAPHEDIVIHPTEQAITRQEPDAPLVDVDNLFSGFDQTEKFLYLDALDVDSQMEAQLNEVVSA